MKLDEFIANTIEQICGGLKTAQKSIGTDASINPDGMTFMLNQLEGRRYNPEDGVIEEFIEFDIAVTQEKGKGTAGGVGVFLGTVNVGTKGESTSNESSMNRIKFRVPIVYPKGITPSQIDKNKAS